MARIPFLTAVGLRTTHVLLRILAARAGVRGSGVGAGPALAGLAALTALLNRQPGAGLLPTTSLALMTVATTLWIASLGFRLTVTVRTVDAVSTGGQVSDWYEPVNSWTGAPTRGLG